MVNKGKMGPGANKEGFLEAVALKKRRDPAQDSGPQGGTLQMLQGL